jgi:hypothetical protein
MWEDMVERLGEIELMGAGTQAMKVEKGCSALSTLAPKKRKRTRAERDDYRPALETELDF